jgi:hypothetical protein
LAATGGHEDVAELLRRHHVMLSASLRVENQEPIAASSPSPDGMERDGLARCYVSWEWFFCRSGIIATRCRLIVGPTRDRVPVSMPTMSSRWWSRSSAGNCLSTDGRQPGGAPRRAYWCATPSNGLLFDAARFKSSASRRQCPQPPSRTTMKPRRYMWRRCGFVCACPKGVASRYSLHLGRPARRVRICSLNAIMGAPTMTHSQRPWPHCRPLCTARPRDAPLKPRHRNWPPEADVQMRAVISDFVNTETGPQMPCLRGHFA